MLAFLLLALSSPLADAYWRIPVEELELTGGAVLPRYAGGPMTYSTYEAPLPWAALDGPGEVLFVPQDFDWNRASESPGVLVFHADAPRDLAGMLFLPKSNGDGFVRLPFRVPAARATATEADFQRGELERARGFLERRLPGSAWFRHRHDVLSTALAKFAPGTVDPANFRQTGFRPEAEALDLFTGGRALYENLQLERGLPASAAGEETVALDSLTGITVKAIDWKARLGAGETKVDALAALVPADQFALFFPSFEGFVAALDEAARLGDFGLSAFESRSADARSRERTERQLALPLSELARKFGPMVVDSVVLTASDPYLRTGTDLALVLRVKTPGVVQAYVATRQAETGLTPVEGKVAGVAYRGVVNPTRTVSSYVATVGDTVVVTNSLVQLERIADAASGAAPALAAAGEERFFRQRYSLGASGESVFVVLPDEAIRRWCSPRWRIASARIARFAAELAEEHAVHFAELVTEPEERDLGTDPAFADLGALRLTADGVHSKAAGTLDFATPIAELPLERVTEREAQLYKTWREGYESAWSNFFDPIGAQVSIAERKVALDLTVMPLIFGTEYSDLREVTHGPGLTAGSGDPHPEALVHFTLSLNPEWEQLKSLGSILGSGAEKLGVDPFAWLGTWVALYVDDGPIWDDLLQAEDAQAALESVTSDPNDLPLAIVIAVANPLKLALFMTSLRAFADGTAPGMTDWKERVVGERRFVEITSPGLGQEFSLFYATTPSALILSLNEPTLLRAMEREERRRTGTPDPASAWDGAHAVLHVRERGLEILELVTEGEIAKQLRRDAWRNLPILNEWKRLHPELDPVALHERVFRERLVCPGGGTYVWNEEWKTMESTVFGHPGAPKPGIVRPPAWSALVAAGFALTFEEDGLRVHAELERK